MTLVIFNQLFEQYEEGKTYNLERSLANGLCAKKIAVTFTEQQKMLKEKELKEKEKESAEKKKAERLLKEKEDRAGSEKADSKKAEKRTKAIKK